MRYRFFYAIFVGIFVLLTPQVSKAQNFEPRCDGVDLRLTLGAQERTQINTLAAATPNSKGLFWKIEKQGSAPSWLLGTIHIGDDRITNRPTSPAESEALDKADRLALELDFDDFAGSPELLLGKALQDYPEIFTYEQDNVLKDSLPTPQFILFEEALKKRGLSYALLSHTKPWLIWTVFNTSPCVAAQVEMDIDGLDATLGRVARASGKPIIGLENIGEQIKAIDSLPLNLYVNSIIQLGFLADRLNDYHETMVALYLEGEIGAIMPTMMALMVRDLEQAGLGDAELSSSQADMLSFETILLNDRNAIMAARAAPLLEEGNSFIAVGALHLVGETGLIEQFRRMGYQVTRIESVD